MANPEHLAILEQGVEAWNKWRDENPDIQPDLSGAKLEGAKLGAANLTRTNLEGANLERAELIRTILNGANLNGTNLNWASLSTAALINANLINADLGGADIFGVNFSSANLQYTDFTIASMLHAIFGDTDLSVATGLESVRHLSPSYISIDTLYKSGGNIPEAFLRGCGAPDTFIAFARSLVNAAIDFYSCFISYSSKNQAFAERLYADLQSKGVRCWFAPEDLKIGEKIRIGIDESIRLHDKLLLVLSKHSVQSEWVEKEVETAMEQERKQKRTVLFPVMLDNSVMKIKSGWPADIRRSRNIGDFRKWKDHDSYSKAFERLLRDLKAESKA